MSHAHAALPIEAPRMTPALRPYQVEGVEALRAAFARGCMAPLYTLPTGAGKTVVFAHIARSAADRGTSVLILVHRRELLLQGSAALRAIGLQHGLIAPGLPLSAAQVRIASVQTLTHGKPGHRRLDFLKPPDLIVIDEAHHAVAGSWRRVVEHWHRSRVLGVTATPERLDGKGLGMESGGVFDALVLGPSVAQLTLDGFLAPAKVLAPPVKVDLDGVRTRMGDFDKKQVTARVDRPTITGDAVQHYLDHGRGGQGIAFCASVGHATHVAEAFTAAGVLSEALDGSMPTSQRDSILARFRAGEIRVLTSCDLVSEGFDLPAASVAILLRPTESLTVYLQQVGRVLRPEEGKEHAIVLDHVGNVRRHGLPSADRTWRLGGEGKRKPAPTNRCDMCFAVHEPAPVCPECGFKYSERVTRSTTGGGLSSEFPSTVDGTLQEVEDPIWNSVAARARRLKMEQGECQSLEELVALGESRGYKNPRGWAWQIWSHRRLTSARPVEVTA